MGLLTDISLQVGAVLRLFLACVAAAVNVDKQLLHELGHLLQDVHVRDGVKHFYPLDKHKDHFVVLGES